MAPISAWILIRRLIRLRIISDTGQNLAHNVNLGGTTAVNTVLNYPALVNGNPALGVTGAAYTNNDLSDTTGTTLFDIDTVRTSWQSSRPRPTARSSPLVRSGSIPTSRLGSTSTQTSGKTRPSTIEGSRPCMSAMNLASIGSTS